MARRICVVGSINMDLVVRAERFAKPGETLLGESLDIHPGGKGANQVVAASRLGADVDLVGCVGDDAWGTELRSALASEGVGAKRLARLAEVRTGVGIITVVPGGENAIVVVPGANGKLSAKHVEDAYEEVAGADMLLLQCEVPPAANLRAAEIAAVSETRIVLNAAPAAPLPPELLQKVDLLVVNLEEARLLAQAEPDVSSQGLARRLGALGPNRVAITLGADGAVLFDGERLHHEPAAEVEVVDTTGAGDAFAAAIAVAILEGMRHAEALRFACAAGAVTTTTPGALSSLPRRKEVDELAGRASREAPASKP